MNQKKNSFLSIVFNRSTTLERVSGIIFLYQRLPPYNTSTDTITCEKDELETIVKVVCWGLLMKMRAEENNNKVLEAINVIELVCGLLST